LSYQPTIPILFLTNTSEHGPIESYIGKVVAKAEAERKKESFGGDEIITPALHAVHREGCFYLLCCFFETYIEQGHNWTNARERWRAFACLIEWAFCGSLVTEFRFDGTRAAQRVRQPPEFVQLPDGRKAIRAVVVSVEDKAKKETDTFLFQKVNLVGNRPHFI
jgi:hypothetical protein